MLHTFNVCAQIRMDYNFRSHGALVVPGLQNLFHWRVVFFTEKAKTLARFWFASVEEKPQPEKTSKIYFKRIFDAPWAADATDP